MSMKRCKQCAICREFFAKEGATLDYSAQFLTEKTGSSIRILYEDDYFIVIPSLGPVSRCHLLVLPKKHVCSFALLEPEWIEMAEILIGKIVHTVEKEYGNIIVFEHGALSEEMEGSASCTHAHMHIVSCKYSILPFLKEDGLHLRSVTRLAEIREQKMREKPYFYYCEEAEGAFIMDDIIRTSQYMRIKIADILGTPEKGNWKENAGIEDMADMFLRMKGIFPNSEGKGTGK